MKSGNNKLPAIDAISDIIINNSVFVGKSINAEQFCKLFSKAVPILPDDPDGWSYSPVGSGTFNYNNQKYLFKLFLGGRGVLIDQKGNRILFEFSAKFLE